MSETEVAQTASEAIASLERRYEILRGDLETVCGTLFRLTERRKRIEAEVTAIDKAIQALKVSK